MKSLLAALASIVFFFSATSAHAVTIDPTLLDTMHAQSKGPFGVLNWPGVSLKITTGYNGKSSGMIESPAEVRIETGTYVALESPEKAALSRIVKGKNGEVTYEHADVSIAPENPTLQISALTTVRLREVARFDAHLERAKTIPIYAYKSDAKHVVVLVEADGSSFGKRAASADPAMESGTCAQNGGSCIVDSAAWHDHIVDLSLGVDSAIAQARGDVTFDAAPKGETNQPHTYIVNASFTQTARDPEPVVAITMHAIETVFRGDGDGE